MQRDLFFFSIFLIIFVAISILIIGTNNIDLKTSDFSSSLIKLDEKIIEKPEQKKQMSKYIESVKYGGLWFFYNQNKNFLYYEYNILEDKHSESNHPLREVAALWSIAKFANFSKRTEFKELTNRGIRYFQDYFVFDEENDFYYLNVDPKNIKLGYSAFMILALIESEYPNKDYYIEKFANSILYHQNEDGSFKTFFFSEKTGGQDFYPGEALTALTHLYEYSGEEKYMKSTLKAFVYYRDYFRESKKTALIPWHTRAYNKLFKQTRSREVAEFIFEMNDYLLGTHYKTGECSGYMFDDGIIVAVRMEGVNQAYEIAKMIGDTKRENCYKQYIKEGADYILSLQIKNSPIYNKQAIGGFKQNKFVYSTRVDRNQHAIMALMNAVELGILK